MAHREGIKRELAKITLSNIDVVDWGCGTKPVTKYVSMGEDVRYFGIDILDHVGADLVTDISKPVVLLKRYAMAFCIETLEHVDDPIMALRNIFQNMTLNGKLYLSVPFMFPVHSEHDLWRFTDQGIRTILTRVGFRDIEIVPTNGTEGWFVKACKRI